MMQKVVAVAAAVAVAVAAAVAVAMALALRAASVGIICLGDGRARNFNDRTGGNSSGDNATVTMAAMAAMAAVPVGVTSSACVRPAVVVVPGDRPVSLRLRPAQ